MKRRGRNLSLALGASLVALLIVLAALGPLMVRYDPFAIDLARTLAPPERDSSASDAMRSDATCSRG